MERKTTSGIGKPFRTGRNDGFTLLEILVVLVLIVVLFGMAAVHFAGLSEERLFGELAAEIKAMTRKTHRTAVIEGRPFVLEITPDNVGGIRIPQGMNLRVRPWGEKGWIQPESFAWNFDPSGLCQPIGIRLERGNSFYEIDFHPLTGSADQERVEIIP